MEVNEIKQGKIVDIEMKMAQDRALKSSKMYKLIKCDNDSLMPIMGHFISAFLIAYVVYIHWILSFEPDGTSYRFLH